MKIAIINVKSNDDFCFLWAVVSALFPTHKNSDRTSSCPHFREVLNYEGISLPIMLKDIKKFEELNNLSINVYTLEGLVNKKKNEVVPLLLSSRISQNRNHINLLSTLR